MTFFKCHTDVIASMSQLIKRFDAPRGPRCETDYAETRANLIRAHKPASYLSENGKLTRDVRANQWEPNCPVAEPKSVFPVNRVGKTCFVKNAERSRRFNFVLPSLGINFERREIRFALAESSLSSTKKFNPSRGVARLCFYE